MEARTIHEAIKLGLERRWEPARIPQPTDVLPGPAKVSILRARVEAGESLFHPDDAPPEVGGEVPFDLQCIATRWIIDIIRLEDDDRFRNRF